MVLYCLLALGLVGFLGTFHCTLVSAGQTTNEKVSPHFFTTCAVVYACGRMY
jgi:hypothetical protein